MLKKVLEQFGLDPERLKLDWISTSEGDRFASVVKSMTEEITKFSPSPLRDEDSK